MKSYQFTFLLFICLISLRCTGPDPGEVVVDTPTDPTESELIEAVRDTISQDATVTEANTPPTSKTPVKPTIADPAQRDKVSLGKSVQQKTTPSTKKAPDRDNEVQASAAKPASTPTPQAEQTTPPSPPAKVYPSHEKWNALLSAHVSGTGAVDYAALKRNEQQLDAYLELLAQETPNRNWDRNEAKAYWLNAYNAFTVKLILDNYPVQKITDLHGGKPWDVKWIKLGGKTYSLNQIEHDIIRPTYQDPRIHFAVNCAAQSCPPLYNRAFTAAGLSSTLTSLTRRFVNNDKYNELAGNEAQVSKLFDWYAEDFGDVVTYLNKYADEPLPASADVSFKEYDWSLNGR